MRELSVQTLKDTVRWVLAPATTSSPTGHAVTVRILSVALGLMWLYNVSWKVPPGFGDSEGGLYKWASLAVEYPVFPPYSWGVEHLVLPAIVPFGWSVLIIESALAVMLLTGAWLRLAGLLGIAQSVAIALSVLHAPHEWPWAYYLMIIAHLVVLFSSAGRVLAVDGLRQGGHPARFVGLVWGTITMIAGAYSMVRADGGFVSPQGEGLVWSSFAVGLGRFNLAGGVLLLVSGALVLLAIRKSTAWSGYLAAALAGLGALSLYAQVGFTDPWLGGNAISAAFLVAVAVVGFSIARCSAGDEIDRA